MRVCPVLLVLCLAACAGDETVGRYGAADQVWSLHTLNGAPFTATATLTFPEAGRITGQAPCNGYAGEMRAPYPWFDTGHLAVTRRACDDALDAETAYFRGLEAATESEVLGDTLILRGPDGEMVFKAGG